MRDGRTQLRFLFLGTGLFLIFCTRFVVHSLPRIVPELREGYTIPEFRLHAIHNAWLSIGIVLLGLACLLTSWGLRRRRTWARSAGMVVSGILLSGFPFLTVLGAAGLVLLIAHKNRLEQQELVAKRSSWGASQFSWIASTVALLVFLAALSWINRAALHSGMALNPASPPVTGPLRILVILIGDLVVTTLHEFGHAAMALAVGFRIRVISIGPLLIWNDRHSRRAFRFDWGRLLVGGGYMGAVPVSRRGVRINHMLVALAGPLLSLLLCSALLPQVFRFAGAWSVTAIFSALFLADFAGNLTPAGNTDGSIFFHLLLGSPKGRERVLRLLSSTDHEEAEKLHGDLDFDQEVATRRRLLEQALAGEHPNPAELTIHYQELGRSLIRISRYEEAEEYLKKSLSLLAEAPGAKAAYSADAWISLHRIYLFDKRLADVRSASQSERTFLEQIKQQAPEKAHLARIELLLAGLARVDGNYEGALESVSRALAILPEHRKHLFARVSLLEEQAQCELLLGRPEDGLKTAAAAAQLLRSAELPDQKRAMSELGVLGVHLWQAGQDWPAYRLLEESVRKLERGGALDAAARLRLVAAKILRVLGRLAEAEAALPNEPGLNQDRLTTRLTARGKIRLAQGRAVEAVADLEAGLALRRAAAHSRPRMIAEAENDLAEALFKAGRVEEGEAVARSAAEQLTKAEHPDLAESLLTVAVIGFHQSRPSAGSFLDQAVRTMNSAVLVLPAEKARFFERAARRLKEIGRQPEAAEMEKAAQAQWEKLGLDKRSPGNAGVAEPSPVPAAS